MSLKRCRGRIQWRHSQTNRPSRDQAHCGYKSCDGEWRQMHVRNLRDKTENLLWGNSSFSQDVKFMSDLVIHATESISRSQWLLRDSQEIPVTLSNLKVHFPVHKSPILDPMLREMNLQKHFDIFNIHFNIKFSICGENSRVLYCPQSFLQKFYMHSCVLHTSPISST
jgi:hypothetical protein